MTIPLCERLALLTAVLSVAFAMAPAAADAQAGWIELGVSHYNSDWQPRASESGLRVAGLWRTGSFYVAGFYNTIDTKAVDLPVTRLRGLPFGNWREAAAGYTTGLGRGTSIELEAGYLGVELYENIESGYALGVRLRRQWAQRMATSIRLSHVELEGSDWRLTGELELLGSERLALVLRLDDFSEFDFTWYEFGLRFSIQ